MAIDWARLKVDIINAAVTAVNATLYIGEERALKDVPVRKVFSGGRQTVRFKTAEEVERDRGLRSRLGLAPEILATPEAIERVRAAGRNPIRSLQRGGKEYGFARTIEFPSNDTRRNRFGQTRADRGLTRNSRNRANDFMPFGEDARHLDRTERALRDREYDRYLTSRGRFEVQSGRAVSQRYRKIEGAKQTIGGLVVAREPDFEVPVGPARVGGGLRSTIRIVRATPESYPVISGSLVAGDREHDYAIHQELGNRHNPAHPFLRPRLPEWKEELPRQLRRSLGRTGR